MEHSTLKAILWHQGESDPFPPGSTPLPRSLDATDQRPPNRSGNCAFVETTGLDAPRLETDRTVHFNRADALELGRRYKKTYVSFE